MSLSQLKAPYNFVPLSGFIFQPDWGNEVSHDIPLDDGLSGTLNVTLNTHSPLLVGQKQIPSDKSNHRPGEVHFCQSNGHYAIPGSSLKGMIRNVVEIASFGKMRMVDGIRLGIRDISGGGHLKDIYANRMKNQKAGFLRLSTDHSDGIVAEITPCEFAHIRHDDLKKHPALKQRKDLAKCLFQIRSSVSKKYADWNKLVNENNSGEDLPRIRFNTQAQSKQEHITLAVPTEQGTNNGELVLTGQISDKCTGKNSKYGKYRDFVFYHKASDNSDTIKVDAKTFADFRKIHGDDDKKHNGSWGDYWKKRFENGYKIPVFYHANGSKARSIGLAYMYKLAYSHSIADVISHTNPLHHFSSVKDNALETEDHYDLAELLFGMIDEDETTGGTASRSLKSRVSFGLCQGPETDAVSPIPADPTILSGPKATYFPNYIQQRSDNNRLRSGQAYTTYMDNNAEIRGWKRYPVRPDNQVRVERPTGKAAKNVDVQVKLHPLPKGTTFHGKIRFHNLKPEELGALLWALHWGGQDNRRHSLGMGKPFGYGQITFESIEATIFDNASLEEQPALTGSALQNWIEEHMTRYQTMMEQAYGNANSVDAHWQDSVQLKELTEMANPDADLAHSGQLQYMQMGMSIAKNDFVQGKKQGLSLPSYSKQDNLVDERIFPRKSAVQLQLAREAREEAHKKDLALKANEAKLANLSPIERSIQEIIQDTSIAPNLLLINALEVGKWESVEEQKQVAQKVKKMMEEQSIWKESTNKKNPLKDKPHQVTLRVMVFL